MKKKACGGQVKKNQQGSKFPTAESAAQRYGNAEYYAAPIDGWKYPNNGYNSIYEKLPSFAQEQMNQNLKK